MNGVARTSAGGLLASLRGPWTIARYTYREGIRKKTLVGFLILSLLVIFGSSFMGAFLNPTTVGDVEKDPSLKLVKDICVTSISIFGVLITIFVSASAVPTELENRVVYTILSKPVRRFQYLLGKFVGVQLIVLINLGLMGALFFMLLYFRQGVMPTLLLWSIFFTYFEFLIVSAFTFAISCTSTSAVLPTIGGLFVWITGSLTEYLKDVGVRSGWKGWAGFEGLRDLYDAFSIEKLVGGLAESLYRVLPNLQEYDLKMQILDKPPNDPPTIDLIPQLIMYGLVYAASGFLLAYLFYRRKEI
ncbi:MAG: ABC transporter permease [Candidatus Hydrogenedentes bacterium]|nr:ABC transporter permease [Candidatus Hydrogenedentota bacterium]